jgi:DNA-binding GntR family transcriptional regulator
MPASSNALVLERPATGAPTTLKSYVFNTLREAIVSGRFKPGQRLNESQLARELNISRIPIREALMQLQEHGLVMNHERRGMFVTELSEEDVQRINSLRVVLEAEALRLCRANMTKQIAAKLTSLVEQMENWKESSEIDAAAIDLEFHRTVWEASGNPYLMKTLDSLSTVLFAHTALENVSHDVMAWRLNHHRDLLDVALGTTDAPAEAAVISHLRMHYKDPERFSSFSSAAPTTAADAA